MLVPTVLHFDVFVRLFRTAAEADSHVALLDTFDHPPYSPDLAPSDFHLFLKMKEHLAGKRHADDEDLQHAVVDWLNSQTVVWYEEGISKLVYFLDAPRITYSEFLCLCVCL